MCRLLSAQTLYAFPGAFRTVKTLIAAKYADVDINVPSFELGKDNKTESFLAKNPSGKIPVLDTPTGPLFESNAIARYIARMRPDAGLFGGSFYENAQVDQWIDFSANELEPARGVWLYTVIGALPSNNPKPLQEAKKDVEAALKVLDQHFLHNTYLVGQGVTLADIAIFAALTDVYAKLLSPESQKAYPNVLRWFHTIANQPHVAEVHGKVTFATAEGQPAAAAKGGKAEKADKADKAAAGGAAKEAKPKEDKPKPAPKPADDGGDDDDDDKPKLKPKNPLDDLPPTSMQLDPIKKLAFSQRPILSDFFEQLWPQFDYSGYTWYTLHYKYNAENTVYFKTGNLVGGFIQRSDAARKYSMGVLNVYGNADEETGPWKVSGAWLFRGPGIIQEMIEENPDQEYYEWRKQDVATDAGKAAIKEQFFAEKIEGEPVLDRRYFK